MPHFTRHAYERFRTRREELVRDGAPLEECKSSARQSYMLGQLITREEAQDRIRGAIRPHFTRTDYIYREDGTGPGVWIARLSRRDEVVVTYLAPRSLAWRLRSPAPHFLKHLRLVVRPRLTAPVPAGKRLRLADPK